jgi:hypothetical protein
MKQQHPWADEDRRRIEQFLRTSARYLELSPRAKVVRDHLGARQAAPPPWMPLSDAAADARRAVGR